MGNFSILHNLSALYAKNKLGITNNDLTKTITRLSSGNRINSGADDAAGLMIADSALQEITNILKRTITLAEEAATETVDAVGRQILAQTGTAALSQPNTSKSVILSLAGVNLSP